MIDYAKGYSASCYAERVDPATWRDVGVIQLTGGTIKREITGKRQSADLSCMYYRVQVEQWVRVYLDIRQDGAVEHVPLFTGLAVSPDTERNGALVASTLTCFSVLKPCEDVLLPRGWYAPAGMSGAELVRRLLSVSPAPIAAEDDAPALAEAIVAEDGESNLSMADRILDAIGWRLRIDGTGTIRIMPPASEPSARFDPVSNDMIEPQVKTTADWYSCPNVFRAVAGDVTGIARDDDPDSPLSTVNRGREVWKKESCSLSASESAAGYARRRLKELQRVRQTVSYTRRYLPDVMPGDIVGLNYPEQNLAGNYGVQSQSITLGYGARTAEQIYKE